jgi:hypothetical protein
MLYLLVRAPFYPQALLEGDIHKENRESNKGEIRPLLVPTSFQNRSCPGKPKTLKWTKRAARTESKDYYSPVLAALFF